MTTVSKVPPYTITNESITIVWNGKPCTVKAGAPNFHALREIIFTGDWDKVPDHLTVGLSVEKWAKGLFKVSNDKVTHDGEAIPRELNRRVLAMASEGKDPAPLLNFWERLKRNPSYRSVNQLWDFLSHSGIPLTEDGCFLAYKGVTTDFKDAHTRTIDNKPGAINKMPRNKISDDPNQSCHVGFHVGALSYAKSFSARTVVCKVDPEHVVCVPYDSNSQKMRVCQYEVLGNYGCELPSTFATNKDIAVGDAYDDEDDNDDYGDELDGELDGESAGEPEDDEDDEVDNVVALPQAKVVSKPKKKDDKAKTMNVSFVELDGLDTEGLLKQSLDVLRKYAAKCLKVIGASKIPGGKPALVARIIETRDS